MEWHRPRAVLPGRHPHARRVPRGFPGRRAAGLGRADGTGSARRDALRHDGARAARSPAAGTRGRARGARPSAAAAARQSAQPARLCGALHRGGLRRDGGRIPRGGGGGRAGRGRRRGSTRAVWLGGVPADRLAAARRAGEVRAAGLRGAARQSNAAAAGLHQLRHGRDGARGSGRCRDASNGDRGSGGTPRLAQCLPTRPHATARPFLRTADS